MPRSVPAPTHITAEACPPAPSLSLAGGQAAPTDYEAEAWLQKRQKMFKKGRSWVAEGSKDVTERALATAKSMLDSYEQPPMDAATDEALRDYIARREREIPSMDSLNQEF